MKTEQVQHVSLGFKLHVAFPRDISNAWFRLRHQQPCLGTGANGADGPLGRRGRGGWGRNSSGFHGHGVGF